MFESGGGGRRGRCSPVLRAASCLFSSSSSAPAQLRVVLEWLGPEEQRLMYGACGSY